MVTIYYCTVIVLYTTKAMLGTARIRKEAEPRIRHWGPRCHRSGGI